MAAPTHLKLAIIGGGPAGLAMAIEYFQAGGRREDVAVFEKGPNVAEAIRRFYPDKKMTIANYKGLPTQTEGFLKVFSDLTKPETLTYFEDLVREHQVPLQLNAEVFKVQPHGGRFQLGVGQQTLTADLVAIGIGILGRPNKPSYKIPGSLRDHILYDLTSQPVTHCKILVVGGGDTSSEYCQILAEEGNEVTLAYRGKEFARMMDQNRSALENLRQQNKIRVRMECDVKEVGEEEGKPKAIFVDENKFPAERFDKVLYAIGGTTPINFLKMAGVDCVDNWPKLGPSGETNQRGLYLIGDLAVGKQGGSIITAYNSAFRSIRHMMTEGMLLK